MTNSIAIASSLPHMKCDTEAQRLTAGGFRCFPLCPVVRPITLGGKASPTSSLPIAAGRFRSIACHLRRISVTAP